MASWPEAFALLPPFGFVFLVLPLVLFALCWAGLLPFFLPLMEFDDVPKKEIEASSSNSTSDSSQCRYDVFLSFRGQDTRKTFTGHLYTALDKANFRIFRDNEELEKGEDIKPEFKKAIHQSRSSVIVFSKDYASSSWCLNELVMILEQKKTSGHVVLPVFYDVGPSDLRKQTGSLAKAFARHQKTQPCETVKEWRKALSEAADLKGMVLQNEEDGDESRFIKKVVRVIEDKLRRMPECVDRNRNLVGLDYRVKDINLWLRDGSDDVGILVLHGMRGIGKTTIARDVYESNLGRFERHSFLENIREMAGQFNGLIQIQKQLLRDISSGGKVEIQSVREGIDRIEGAISSKKVLLVLDDVDCTDQLDGVLRMQHRFYPGSKIIITTNNAWLLNSYHQAVEVREVQTLYEAESLELLSLYAFGQHHPPEAYMNHSERMVQHCAGLPLALKILGSSLSGKSIASWENALKKLEVIQDGQIWKKLKISYDSLEDSNYQGLFLHIACFFVGMDKDVVVTILDACGFHTNDGIENLIGRHLVIIDYHNRVEMHDMIRDMGRKIALEESPEYPGERSRLWYYEDSYNVLTEMTGTGKIGGLALNMQMSTESRYSDEVTFETNAFSRMLNLKILQLTNVQLDGSYKEFPKGLRWLCWCLFPLDSLPSDISLKSLSVLEMRYSKLTHVWKGTKCLPSLKILDLSHSHDLTETPDFSLVRKLEKLILIDCESLVDVHESLGSLEKLVYLNMEDCKSIKKLPTTIYRLTLERLILSGCSNLDLSREMVKMESLKVFHADGVKLLPGQTVSYLSYLPHRIIELSLRRCNLSDDDFSANLGNLLFLRKLDLSENPFSSLPDFVRGLVGLSSLSFDYCDKLESLERLPGVRALSGKGCFSVKKVTFQSFNDFCRTDLLIPKGKCLEMEYMYKLDRIEKFDAEMIDVLGLSNLKYFEEIMMLGILAEKLMRSPIQGLYEYGIFSTFLPGNEIPASFNNESRGESSISFTVPLCPDHLRIRGLNFFAVYAMVDIDKAQWSPLEALVSNMSKRLEWKYYPIYVGLPDEGQDMIWLSHWKFGNMLEPGDELTFQVSPTVKEMSALDLDNTTDRFYDAVAVKEFGFQFVYEEEEAMMSALDNTTDLFYPHVISGDFSLHDRGRLWWGR